MAKATLDGIPPLDGLAGAELADIGRHSRLGQSAGAESELETLRALFGPRAVRLA